MSIYVWLGYAAAALTTLSFVPQVWKTWKSRSSRDLSRAMLVAFSLGSALWLVYGLAIHSMPMIMANSVTLILSLMLVAMKVAFRN